MCYPAKIIIHLSLSGGVGESNAAFNLQQLHMISRRHHVLAVVTAVSRRIGGSLHLQDLALDLGSQFSSLFGSDRLVSASLSTPTATTRRWTWTTRHPRYRLTGQRQDVLCLSAGGGDGVARPVLPTRDVILM